MGGSFPGDARKFAKLRFSDQPTTDADGADFDQDELGNWDELYLWGIDPLDSDSDDDGLPDGWEIRYFSNTGASAAQDSDSDGVSNLVEYQKGSNPMSSDSDGDTPSDSVEINTHATNPRSRDTDGDGLLDGLEIAQGTNPLSPNDAATDWDGDGYSNVAEGMAGTIPTSNSSRPGSAATVLEVFTPQD